MYYLGNENKGTDKCVVTVQLICAFDSCIYVKGRFFAPPIDWLVSMSERDIKLNPKKKKKKAGFITKHSFLEI